MNKVANFQFYHQRKHRNTVLADAYSHIYWGRFRQDYSAVEKAQAEVDRLMAKIQYLLEERLGVKFELLKDTKEIR